MDQENKYENTMSQKEDEALVRIVTLERDKYEPLAVEAAQKEISKRKIDRDTFENIAKEAATQAKKRTGTEQAAVNSGIRFINFLVDLIAFILVGTFIIYLFGLFSTSNDGLLFQSFYTIIYFVAYLAYYLLMEQKYQKTLGKFVTKTKVVTLSGEKPNSSTIALRTIFRIVPFDRISYLISRRGLHDYLSGTTVIIDK